MRAGEHCSVVLRAGGRAWAWSRCVTDGRAGASRHAADGRMLSPPSLNNVSPSYFATRKIMRAAGGRWVGGVGDLVSPPPHSLNTEAAHSSMCPGAGSLRAIAVPFFRRRFFRRAAGVPFFRRAAGGSGAAGLRAGGRPITFAAWDRESDA